MEDNRTESDINLSEASETAGTAVAGDAPASPTGRTEDVQQQRDEYRDLLLRKTAEFDNFRKRTERERQALSEAAAADLIEELLPPESGAGHRRRRSLSPRRRTDPPAAQRDPPQARRAADRSSRRGF
jgi:hypothetical protein